jgi:hypothetical protein
MKSLYRLDGFSVKTNFEMDQRAFLLPELATIALMPD